MKGISLRFLKNLKKHDKIALLAKSKFNNIQVLISKAPINSDITHDEFVSAKYVLRENNDMKKQSKTIRVWIQIMCKYGWYDKYKYKIDIYCI